eukprot:scaffold64921_cov38-Cyclotella_meneghiniana.AAC.1
MVCEPSSWSVVLGAPSVWLGEDDSAFAMEGGRGGPFRQGGGGGMSGSGRHGVGGCRHAEARQATVTAKD